MRCCLDEEVAMSSDHSAVDRYHHCIQEKRRRATSLTIEIGLNAQDEDDAIVLERTIERLDSAIEILEQAGAIVMAASNAADERMMGDLGHSMAPIDFSEQITAAASRDALQFFA
jgi:hypothetical protein